MHCFDMIIKTERIILGFSQLDKPPYHDPIFLKELEDNVKFCFNSNDKLNEFIEFSKKVNNSTELEKFFENFPIEKGKCILDAYKKTELSFYNEGLSTEEETKSQTTNKPDDQEDSSTEESNQGLSTIAIIGIIAGILLLIIGIYLLYKNFSNKKESKKENTTNEALNKENNEVVNENNNNKISDDKN